MKKLIQIGTCEGMDAAWEFIKTKEFECILVEPNPKSMIVLKNNYKDIPNLHFENIAVSDTQGIKTLYVDNYDVDKYAAGEGVTPHASFDINFQYAHLHGLGRDVITELCVATNTIDGLIKKYQWENDEIEYLFIDTEGHDCDIILSTNFSKYKIKLIKFETTHSDGTFTKGPKLIRTVNHLIECGYTVLKEESYDITMVKS